MAKIETPAEASISARPPRPAAEIPAERSADRRVGEPYASARNAPGLAKARARRSELADTTRSSIPPDLLDPDLLGDDDVLDEDAALANELFARSRAGRMGAARVPVANLEPPSPTRLELTPSPVPRVQLEPATGAVDVSLVPGPNAPFSRHMPTIAAQHALGRRGPVRRDEAPRGEARPARAMTLPPTESTAGEPRVTADVPREFRSSKREVVLGLGIGLGLSMLLAAVGQAYLRENVVADRQGNPAVRESASIESVTLSARPEAPAIAPATAASGTRAVAPLSREPALGKGAARGVRSERAGSVASDGATARGVLPSGPASARPPTVSAREASLSAPAPRAEAPLEPARAKRAARVPERATERERRPLPPATQPPAFELEKPIADAPPERAPLSPAESAGLGLDLPL
jgi:hypothetical protein